MLLKRGGANRDNVRNTAVASKVFATIIELNTIVLHDYINIVRSDMHANTLVCTGAYGSIVLSLEYSMQEATLKVTVHNCKVRPSNTYA